MPRDDLLLATREDVFDDYGAEGFEAAFAERFALRRREPINDSRRVLYWLEAK